jgi:hypothetical protein
MINTMTDNHTKRLVIRIFGLRYEQRRELEKLIGADENILDTYNALPIFISWTTDNDKWNEIEMYLERQKVR